MGTEHKLKSVLPTVINSNLNTLYFKHPNIDIDASRSLNAEVTCVTQDCIKKNEPISQLNK